MEQYFAGKTALVTGAASGIGAAIALLYATYGAKVIVSDTSEKGGNDTVAKIKSKKGDATFIRADMGNPAECEQLIKRTIETYGSIDIACNNAGISGEPRHPADKNMEAFENEADISSSGLFYCMKYEIEAMQKQGGGVIVNMASIPGAASLSSFSPYVDTKYGMVDLIGNTPGEYSARRGIRINAVTPAFINTALLEDTNPTEKKALVKSPSMGRLDKVGDVAGLVVWLSSDKAPFANDI